MRRRLLLGVAACAALSACGPAPPPLPPLPRRVAPADLLVAQLTDLVPIAGLQWLALVRPSRLIGTPWLKPSLGRVLKDKRLELVEKTTGLDYRESPELALAGFGNDAVLQLVRHRKTPTDVEKHFRERLTSGETRSEIGHQAISLWGNVGTKPQGFVSVGVDVAGFQDGGSAEKGPGRIALLYALGKLDKVPRALTDETLAALHKALGAEGVPPAQVLFPGPFDDEIAGGVRGLLGASTGVGISMTPTDTQTMRVVLLIAGDFSAAMDKAQALLLAAWGDLAQSDLGHLLGLTKPRVEAQVTTLPLGLALGVELDPATLFDGLAAATMDNVEQIMR